MDGRGNAYINNQGFEFPGGKFASGSIVLLTPDGSARQVADDIPFPNGMAVSDAPQLDPDCRRVLWKKAYGV